MKKILSMITAIFIATVGLRARADFAPFIYNTTSLTSAVVNTAYSTSIYFTYRGNSTPTVSIVGLPKGLSTTSSNNQIKVNDINGEYGFDINGIPTVEGNYPLTITYNDLTQTAQSTQNINLQVGSSFFIDTFNTIEGTLMPQGTTGTAYPFEFGITYTGNQTPTSLITGLPDGITSAPIYQNSGSLWLLDLKGTPTTAGTYNPVLTLSDGITNYTDTLILVINQGKTAPITPSASTITTDPVGTNININNTIFMIAPDGTRRPYTSAGAFLSYGFNTWAGVVTASAADIALPVGSFIPPRDGSVINDGGTIYVISNGKRAGIANPSAYLGLGYTWSEAIQGDTSFLNNLPAITSALIAHLSGTLINNNGTIQLVTTNGLEGIPDPATLESWGYSFSEAVSANSADKALSQIGVIPTRQAGQLSLQ
jgi:hypothetical protein